jgi:HD-GYP domain-containing protein (c-di-GMP phosphodiesterase class II)
MPVEKKTAEIISVVGHLNAAVSNKRLYAAHHPQVLRYLNHAHEALSQVLGIQMELTFIIVDEEVVANNHPLSSKGPHLRQFAEMLNNKAIERITFLQGLSIEELTGLIEDLAADKTVMRSGEKIKLGKIKIPDTDAKLDALSPEAHQKMKELGLLDDKPIDKMKELFHHIQTTQKMPVDSLKQVVHGFVSGMLFNIQPLSLLTSLKSSDEYTFTHAINVCVLTMAQAELLGIKKGRLYDIGVAAALHDIGKIFIPDEILNKPGKLTDEERALMQHHTVRGARYILKMDGLPRLAFIAALEHHIRYDGSGYPELRKGWKPNIVSQMIAVADLFDAMRSHRPYQDSKPDDMIINILTEESGTTFDPQLVTNFLHIIKPRKTASSET